MPARDTLRNIAPTRGALTPETKTINFPAQCAVDNVPTDRVEYCPVAAAHEPHTFLAANGNYLTCIGSGVQYVKVEWGNVYRTSKLYYMPIAQ